METFGETQEDIRDVVDEEDVATDSHLAVQVGESDEENGSDVMNDVFSKVTTARFVENGVKFSKIETKLILIGKFHEGSVFKRPVTKHRITSFISYRKLKPRFFSVTPSTK